MSILSRFNDIMRSNYNAILDKVEDPVKMIDQMLRNLHFDLSKVRGETATVIADEAKAKRNLDKVNEDIVKMQSYAEKAIISGNDSDATKFLLEKSKLIAKQSDLQQIYDVSVANTMKMRQMHDKLVGDIELLESRRDTIKAKFRLAKAQQDINKMTSKIDSVSGFSTFQRIEDRVDSLLDIARAESELNITESSYEIACLAEMYDVSPDKSVQEELNMLKANLGMVAVE